MSTGSKIQTLLNTKENIRNSINTMNRGAQIATETPFSQYAQFISRDPVMFTGTISGNCDVSYTNSAGELVQASSPGSISVPKNSFIFVQTDISYISGSDPSYSGCQQVSRLLGGSNSIVIMGYTKAYVYYITNNNFNIEI